MVGDRKLRVNGIYLNEEDVALHIKKDLLEQKRNPFACLFSRGKGETAIPEFLSPLYL